MKGRVTLDAKVKIMVMSDKLIPNGEIWCGMDAYAFLKDFYDQYDSLRKENEILQDIAKAAKAYETYLPDMGLRGPAKYSSQLKAAMKLRKMLKKIENEK